MEEEANETKKRTDRGSPMYLPPHTWPLGREADLLPLSSRQDHTRRPDAASEWEDLFYAIKRALKSLLHGFSAPFRHSHGVSRRTFLLQRKNNDVIAKVWNEALWP